MGGRGLLHWKPDTSEFAIRISWLVLHAVESTGFPSSNSNSLSAYFIRNRKCLKNLQKINMSLFHLSPGA